jgi:hypothetical protein
MIDIMAECPDQAAYEAQLSALREKGFVFRHAEISVVLNGDQVPGLWLRACFTIPPASETKLFEAPIVEYRYSEGLQGWTADGVTTSTMAESLHDNLSSQGIPQ